MVMTLKEWRDELSEKKKRFKRYFEFHRLYRKKMLAEGEAIGELSFQIRQAKESGLTKFDGDTYRK